MTGLENVTTEQMLRIVLTLLILSVNIYGSYTFVTKIFPGPLKPTEKNHKRLSFIRTSNGLSDISHHDKNIIYGRNEITVQVPRIFQILITEILNPFYVFQVFSGKKSGYSG